MHSLSYDLSRFPEDEVEAVETRRCVIRGRVQGVGFRYYVVRNARELGVRGTVRNRSDGAVEAVLQAPSRKPLDALVDRLRTGPRAARVDELAVESVPEPTEEHAGFEVIW